VTILNLTNRVTFQIYVLCCRVTVVVHLLSRRVMVAGLRLVFCHFVLRLIAGLESLLISPGSPGSSGGFHQPLALVLAKNNDRGKDSKAQKFSLIHINQSNELSTNTEKQDGCNNFRFNKFFAGPI